MNRPPHVPGATARAFRRRALPLAAGSALALVLAFGAATPAPASDPLESWRALPGSAAGRGLVALARSAMSGSETGVVAPGEMPPPPAALYVTLVGATGTRACVGEDPPRGADLADAVAALAAQVCTGDRRRPPVRAAELASLRVVIALAAPAEPVASPHEVDPGREGLLVETARGRIAFLPGEARTVSWAIREARRIGVLEGPLSAARCSRFQVVTLEEAAPPAAPAEDPDAVP